MKEYSYWSMDIQAEIIIKRFNRISDNKQTGKVLRFCAFAKIKKVFNQQEYVTLSSQFVVDCSNDDHECLMKCYWLDKDDN